MPLLINQPVPAPAADATAAPAAAAANADRTRGAPAGAAAPRNQRARIDPTVDDPGAALTPMQVALAHIESHTASLRDGLSDLLSEKGKELTLLRHRIHTKDRTLSRLEKDDDRLPVSARLSFKLSCLKGADELPEFQELANRNADVVAVFCKQLKSHIIECGKIELVFLRQKLAEQFATTIHHVVSLFHIAQQVEPAKTHPTALRLISEHADTLLKHTPSPNFTAVYTTVNDVGTLSLADRQNTNVRAAEIRRALEAVFVASWDAYLTTSAAQDLALDLRKHAREHLLANKTEEAANMVDDELPATRQQLQDLINLEVSRATKKLAQRRPSDRTSKNSTRGRTSDTSGASQRNPSRRRGNSSASAPPRRGGRAAGPSNGGAAAKTKSNKKRSISQSKQRGSGKPNGRKRS